MVKRVTEQDKANQLAVARKLSGLWGCTFREAGDSDFSPQDYIFTRDGADVWAEIKCRMIPSSKFKTYFVSDAKVTKLQEVNGILIARFTDRIIWFGAHAPKQRIEWGGRADRDGATNDQENMAHYPPRVFCPAEQNPFNGVK